MRLDRDGTASVLLADGRSMTASLGHDAFESTSAILSTVYLPSTSQLKLHTIQNDELLVELPQFEDFAPLQMRPTIYLDQNHWSTLTSAIYEPDRIPNDDERAAASQLINLANDRKIVLPMSSAHISETCKQVDFHSRYNRALTISQLSAGWQLRDPLHLRQLELQRALAGRYDQPRPAFPAPITLEPNAVHSGRVNDSPPVDVDLPPDAQQILHAIQCAVGLLDTMLDAEHVPMSLTPGWASGFQEFATFLRDNPTDPTLKRRRTHAKFIADLGKELPLAAHQVHITPEQMSDWTMNHSEQDLRGMPSLGLFREVLHEKLADGRLQWRDNDLVDMMYLIAAAGYCDHVVAERSHASHIQNSLRRLGRDGDNIHRNLRSVLGVVSPR